MTNVGILIVEDEWLVAEGIRNSLSRLQYTVKGCVASGWEALERMRDDRPDLVLMDIVLRGFMDGIETSRLLRGAFDIPIVFLTAYSDETTLQRVMETNPYGYVLKPFEDRELNAAISLALHRHENSVKTQRRIDDLEAALADVRSPRDIDVLCCVCRKVLVDDTNWEPIEKHLRDSHDITFTHGYCPACARKISDEIDSS